MSCDLGETTESLELCSFSKLFVASPTSQFILKTLPLLYLRQSSFSNRSVASPTSQLILQPFFRFSYVTGFSLTSPGEPPMGRSCNDRLGSLRLHQQSKRQYKQNLVCSTIQLPKVQTRFIKIITSKIDCKCMFRYFQSTINPLYLLISYSPYSYLHHHHHHHYHHHRQSHLPKGKSFTASAGTQAVVLPKAGLPPQTQEPMLQFYQGLNKCASFPLHSAPHSLFSI